MKLPSWVVTCQHDELVDAQAVQLGHRVAGPVADGVGESQHAEVVLGIDPHDHGAALFLKEGDVDFDRRAAQALSRGRCRDCRCDKCADHRPGPSLMPSTGDVRTASPGACV